MDSWGREPILPVGSVLNIFCNWTLNAALLISGIGGTVCPQHADPGFSCCPETRDCHTCYARVEKLKCCQTDELRSAVKGPRVGQIRIGPTELPVTGEQCSSHRFERE